MNIHFTIEIHKIFKKNIFIRIGTFKIFIHSNRPIWIEYDSSQIPINNNILYVLAISYL